MSSAGTIGLEPLVYDFEFVKTTAAGLARPTAVSDGYWRRNYTG
jgi:hypothetical protein